MLGATVEPVDGELVEALAIAVTPANPEPAAMPPITTRRVLRGRDRPSLLGRSRLDEMLFMRST